MKYSKRIIFFGWFFYPKIGGAETILLNQARELVSRGYQVAVITSPVDGQTNVDETIFNIKVFRRDFVNSRSVFSDEYINRNVSQILNSFKPDIFHFHNGSYPSGSSDKSLGASNVISIFNTVSKLKIPIIEHAHNAQLRDNQKTESLRNLPWDYLICVSNFVLEQWKKLGTNAKQKSVVYNGINTLPFLKSKPNSKITTISKKYPNSVILFSPARLFSLTTGELNQQKNLILVFKALNILKNRDINNFVLVSIYNNIDKFLNNFADKNVSKIIKENNIEDNIELISVIDPDDMPAFYAGADIVCVPSLYETFGLMYLEAMLSGKIVISSNQGGPLEFIKDGKTGFCVDPYDEIKLADLLEKLIKDKLLRKKIGLAARKSVQKYSVKNMVDQIESIYLKLFNS